MSAQQNLWTHSPIKKILNKIGDSYQTYVNYYKTHTMATHYGEIGKPLEKDADPQETDAAIQDEYQTDINDFQGFSSSKTLYSDINTSVSCFMEIPQKEKESLAAYMH